MYRRILVASDGSELAQRAASSAIGLANSTGAELIALNVVPCYPTSFFEGGSSIPVEEIARTERQWSDQGRSIVAALVQQATDAGVKAHGAIAHSDLVGEAILAAARKHEADLIVMASHGRKGLQRLLLGSETQHVLAQGSVPVLVVR